MNKQIFRQCNALSNKLSHELFVEALEMGGEFPHTAHLIISMLTTTVVKNLSAVADVDEQVVLDAVFQVVEQMIEETTIVDSDQELARVSCVGSA